MYTLCRDELPSGLRVVSVEVPHLHSAMVSLFVLAGSRHDPLERSGLSHFLEHVFFRGCAEYPSSRLLCAALERVGGNLNAATTRDYASYYTMVHPEGVPLAFHVAGRMLSSPLMEDIEVEREVILEEILDEVDEDGRLIDVDTISKRAAFPGHTLSLPIAGSSETVREIGLEDLRRHHENCYGPENVVLCVAGPVRHGELLERAADSFGDLPSGPRERQAPPPPLPAGPRLLQVTHKESQSTVRITFPALTEDDPEYAAQVVLCRILDDGLASRLQQEIVEARGLAYSVGADVDLMADAALLELDAQTTHSKLPELIAALKQTLAGLVDFPPERDEVERAIARHRYDMDFMHDSVAELSGWFGVGELHENSVPLEHRIEAVGAVTAEDVQCLAGKLLRPERALVVVVGLADETATQRVVEEAW